LVDIAKELFWDNGYEIATNTGLTLGLFVLWICRDFECPFPPLIAISYEWQHFTSLHIAPGIPISKRPLPGLVLDSCPWYVHTHTFILNESE